MRHGRILNAAREGLMFTRAKCMYIALKRKKKVL